MQVWTITNKIKIVIDFCLKSTIWSTVKNKTPQYELELYCRIDYILEKIDDNIVYGYLFAISMKLLMVK